MKYSTLLLDSNKYLIRKPRIVNCRFVFENKNRCVDGTVIKKIIGFVNAILHYYPGVKLPIYFQLGKIQFADKLTCSIFETICYLLITQYGYSVCVKYTILPGIAGEGGNSSPLLLLNQPSTSRLVRFREKFLSDIYKNHYRRVVCPSDDKTLISQTLGDIKSFLQYNDIDSRYCCELSIVVAELVGNALEHNCSDCLVDVDVTNSYQRQLTNEPFLGINIVVMNFSPKQLGDDVRHRIFGNIENLPEAYKKVRCAYDIHTNYFGEDYCDRDFFNIASFQHKISGDSSKVLTGGTGLTTVLRSVETRAESHMCYCLSGNRGLQFIPYEITRNENGIGFNKENDFYHFPPSRSALLKCPIYIPGTAYNLTFVLPRAKETYFYYE